MLHIALNVHEDRAMRADPRGVDAYLVDLLEREHRSARRPGEIVHTVVTDDQQALAGRVIVVEEPTPTS